MPLSLQQPLKHPASGERIVQMQLVDPAHQNQIGRRRRPRQVIDAATADAEQPGLAGNGKVVGPVDHRFPLNSPALPSAPAKKSFSSVNSPILA